MNLHQPYATEEEYYKPIEDLVGKTITYYGMKCEVNSIAKYVRPQDFDKCGFRCIYILKIINPTPKQLKTFEDGFLFANTSSIMHSYDLDKN